MKLVFKAKSWWKSEWDLLSGERVVATVAVKNWSYSTAEVTIGSAKWSVGYVGWMGNKLYVRDAAGKVVAEAVPKKWYSSDVDVTLEGRRYQLRSNSWQTRFYALDDSGAEVLTLQGWWNGGGEVTTSRSADDTSMLLLANLLFYQYKALEMNSGSTGAVVS